MGSLVDRCVAHCAFVTRLLMKGDAVAYLKPFKPSIRSFEFVIPERQGWIKCFFFHQRFAYRNISSPCLSKPLDQRGFHRLIFCYMQPFFSSHFCLLQQHLQCMSCSSLAQGLSPIKRQTCLQFAYAWVHVYLSAAVALPFKVALTRCAFDCNAPSFTHGIPHGMKRNWKH